MTKKADMKINKEADEKIKNLQKALQDQIDKFEQKQTLINHRNKFLATKESLQGFVSDQGSDYNEFLEDSGKKILFKDNDSFRDSDAISISNNFLVREFVQFLNEKIDNKLTELEKEIIA